MPDAKPNFLDKFLDVKATDEKSFSSERQHTAQAFNLHVEWKDGRRAEGIAWSHYVGYRWIDDGNAEKLVVLFGDRALELEGHNLGVLVREIREGQLNGIKELATGQGTLLQQSNPDNQPIIMGVSVYPDFDEILMEIKGETHVRHGHTKRIER